MEERCSARQLGVLVFVALLAPASALPGMVARGGALGWLAPVAAMPIAAGAAAWLRRLGPEGLMSRLKGFWGGFVLTLYYIWAMGLSALTAGSCVDRLSRTDYLAAPNWLLSLALVGTATYLACRGRGTFVRAVEIFYLALLVVLALFLTLGMVNLDPENLRPAGVEDLSGPATGLLPVLSTLSVGALAAFLPRTVPTPTHRPDADPTPDLPHSYPDPPASHPRSTGRWLLGWCAVAAALCLLTLGALGPRLTARAPLPFFLALQGVGFQGGFQRLEALGTAAWVLSDLALLGLAALSAQAMAGGRKWALYPPLLAGLLGGCFLGNGVVAPYSPLLLPLNLALGGILPILLVLRPVRISCG